MRHQIAQWACALAKYFRQAAPRGDRLRASRGLFAEPLEDRRMLASSAVNFMEDVALASAAPDSATELIRIVSSSHDDAEEKSGGKMQVGNSDLELVDDGSRTGRTVGVRFQDIDIPVGADILSADIIFTVDETDAKPASIQIHGQSSADADAFSSRKHNLSSRETTDAGVLWSPDAWDKVGESGSAQQTPDLTSIVEEIIHDPDWAAGNAMAFLFTGSGERTAESYDGKAAAAPQLRIVYDTGSDPATPDDPNSDSNSDSDSDTQPPVSYDATTTIMRSVSQSSDDAKENSKGRVKTGTSDLKTHQFIGLRFQAIAIPKGSQIVDARIQFQVDEATYGSVSLNIFGELADDAQTFSTARHDISARTPTAAGVVWEPPAWTIVGETGPAQQTPNLAAIVQEIVDRDGWEDGNSLAFTISGSGKRIAESFDGGFAPVLIVTYAGEPSPSFAGLYSASDVVYVDATNRKEKYDVKPAEDRAFDARGASFVISETTHGMIVLEGDASQTGMYWAGGYVTGDKPWDASWDDWKNDPATLYSAVIYDQAQSATISGMHFFNVHDGPRIGPDATDWTVENVWGEYIRDDAIENDHLISGKVVDSLFDGAYTGISTRPSKSQTQVDGHGKVMTLDRVLLRLEASPYPYKYQEKPGILDENGDPWDGTGVPYGHGNLFKYDMNDIDRNIHFVIKDSVFVLPHDNVPQRQISLPPAELIDELSNVTIVWLGSGDYYGNLPTEKFPGQITVLTGQEGLDFWQAKVADWHERHPDVDPARKPAEPGKIEFPRVF